MIFENLDMKMVVLMESEDLKVSLSECITSLIKEGNYPLIIEQDKNSPFFKQVGGDSLPTDLKFIAIILCYSYYNNFQA